MRHRSIQAVCVVGPAPVMLRPPPLGVRVEDGVVLAIAVAVAAAPLAHAAEPISYAVLFIDPMVDRTTLLAVPGRGRVGAIQVGAVGLATESVPKTAPGEGD